MKAKNIAFALSAAISVASPCIARAASQLPLRGGNLLTPYAVLDIGLASQTNATSAGTKTGFLAGPVDPDILGIKGSHALPGGNRVVYQFEAGTNMETGAQGFGAQQTWGRQANVGLAGSWGSLRGGYELTPFISDMGAFDPLGISQSGSILPYYLDAIGGTGIFDSRMFQYRSPESGALHYSAGLGTGNVPGSSGSGLEFQATATYQAGRFGFGGGFVHVNSSGTAQGATKSYWGGLNYVMGSITLRGLTQYSSVTRTTGISRKTIQIGGGFDWRLGNNYTLEYGIYKYWDTNDSNNHSLMNAALLNYTLDSSTTVYGGATYLTNSGNMAVNPLNGSSWGNDTQPAGSNTAAVLVGFRYQF